MERRLGGGDGSDSGDHRPCQLGFEIVQTLIVDTEPDKHVKRAMSEIVQMLDFMDMVLVTQYFITMKEIGALSESNSVFITHGPGTVKDIASQIRDKQIAKYHSELVTLSQHNIA
ncbi:hypothetical protein SO802_010683 [Lithocarpus litseifolius]|uniref:Uncharacterized protein n=1 Tax=Lithocarpus litseifolius TaxID=425828 RepID=A0AAW2DJE6_9ROSI